MHLVQRLQAMLQLCHAGLCLQPLPGAPAQCLLSQGCGGVVSLLFEEQLTCLCVEEGLQGWEATRKNSNPSWLTSCFETQGWVQPRMGVEVGKTVPMCPKGLWHAVSLSSRGLLNVFLK